MMDSIGEHSETLRALTFHNAASFMTSARVHSDSEMPYGQVTRIRYANARLSGLSLCHTAIASDAPQARARARGREKRR